MSYHPWFPQVFLEMLSSLLYVLRFHFHYCTSQFHAPSLSPSTHIGRESSPAHCSLHTVESLPLLRSAEANMADSFGVFTLAILLFPPLCPLPLPPLFSHSFSSLLSCFFLSSLFLLLFRWCFQLTHDNPIYIPKDLQYSFYIFPKTCHYFLVTIYRAAGPHRKGELSCGTLFHQILNVVFM